jgi:hypothetical protein
MKKINIFKKIRTQLLSEMFDSVDESGIYDTTTFYKKLDSVFVELSTHKTCIYCKYSEPTKNDLMIWCNSIQPQTEEFSDCLHNLKEANYWYCPRFEAEND